MQFWKFQISPVLTEFFHFGQSVFWWAPSSEQNISSSKPIIGGTHAQICFDMFLAQIKVKKLGEVFPVLSLFRLSRSVLAKVVLPKVFMESRILCRNSFNFVINLQPIEMYKNGLQKLTKNYHEICVYLAVYLVRKIFL